MIERNELGYYRLDTVTSYAPTSRNLLKLLKDKTITENEYVLYPLIRDLWELSHLNYERYSHEGKVYCKYTEEKALEDLGWNKQKFRRTLKKLEAVNLVSTIGKDGRSNMLYLPCEEMVFLNGIVGSHKVSQALVRAGNVEELLADVEAQSKGVVASKRKEVKAPATKEEIKAEVMDQVKEKQLSPEVVKEVMERLEENAPKYSSGVKSYVTKTIESVMKDTPQPQPHEEPQKELQEEPQSIEKVEEVPPTPQDKADLKLPTPQDNDEDDFPKLTLKMDLRLPTHEYEYEKEEREETQYPQNTNSLDTVTPLKSSTLSREEFFRIYGVEPYENLRLEASNVWEIYNAEARLNEQEEWEALF